MARPEVFFDVNDRWEVVDYNWTDHSPQDHFLSEDGPNNLTTYLDLLGPDLARQLVGMPKKQFLIGFFMEAPDNRSEDYPVSGRIEKRLLDFLQSKGFDINASDFTHGVYDENEDDDMSMQDAGSSDED